MPSLNCRVSEISCLLKNKPLQLFNPPTPTFHQETGCPETTTLALEPCFCDMHEDIVTPWISKTMEDIRETNSNSSF